jgi:hypothetical protein
VKTHERRLPDDNVDSAKQRFEGFHKGEFRGLLKRVLSESDTRSKIIDAVIKEVLGWPETHIEREPHVQETGGYIDYLLSTSHPYFVIEATRIQL